MKIFGIEFKFNGFDIWHKGNFTPPTKLSQFENDIGAGAGLKIIVATTDPGAGLSTGDWWYREI